MNEINWFWFIVGGLAVYRASRMIGLDTEEGPFSIFQKWRNFLGQETWIGRGFHCPLCVSVWAALAAAIVLGWGLPVLHTCVLWFGLSGFAVILHKVLG